MRYVKQFGIIIGITCAGEVMNYLLPVPVPGSIYGMVMLFLLLASGVLKLEQVEKTGDFLVNIMPVMFIPAAVGIMDATIEVQSMLLPILIAVLPITCFVMVVTGKTTEYFVERKGRKNE